MTISRRITIRADPNRKTATITTVVKLLPFLLTNFLYRLPLKLLIHVFIHLKTQLQECVFISRCIKSHTLNTHAFLCANQTSIRSWQVVIETKNNWCQLYSTPGYTATYYTDLRMPALVLATLLPVQLPTDNPGKAAEGNPSTWAPVSHMELWVPSFTLAQHWPL